MSQLFLWATGGTIIGSIMGSFLSTLVVRWPQNRSVISGRSACDTCGVMLRPLHMIPLLSFLQLRGRCAACGDRIAIIHPLMEIGCAAIGLLALLVMPGFDGLALALYAWLLLTLAVLDVRHLWLPDRLTLPLAVGGLVFGGLVFQTSLNDRVIGGLAGFLCLAAIASAYRLVRKRDGMGGGDPKLLAAIGLWLGWPQLPFVILLAATISLVAALIVAARMKTDLSTMQFPFGSAMALSGVVIGFASFA